MTATVTSSSTSRQLLGSLTTVFTLPQECTIFAAQEESDTLRGFWAGQGCTSSEVVDTVTCWPSIDPSVLIPQGPLHGLGFYSPGLICPSSWTTACTAASLLNGAPSPLLTGTSFKFQFPLEPGETAVGCCPP